MATAVTIVKTKLIGTARSFVTNEATIDDIVAVLTTNIKFESSKVVSSKLLAYKQGNKSSVDYTKEIESISASLKRAFMSEGVPIAAAERYSVDTLVKAVASNSNNENVKRVMQAADFKTVSDVTAKFMSVTTEETANKSQVLHYKRFNNNYRGWRKNFRGNNRGQRGGYGNGYGNRNYENRGNGNNGSNGSRGGYSRQNNSYRGNSRGQNQFVRFTENLTGPQRSLGESAQSTQ